MTEIALSERAKRDLRALDPAIAVRILRKLSFFRKQDDPLRFAKRLTDPRLGTYRFRIGDYRVLFDVDRRGRLLVLLILAIRHRREAYV